MNTAPETVVTYLDELDSSCELTGYLCVNDDGYILFNAGKIGEFNFTELDKNKSAIASVPFLEGLLPANSDSTIVIGNVHIDDNNYFDIHLLNNDVGYWVLFFDTALSGIQLQEEQQVRLDVDFINDKRKTGS